MPGSRERVTRVFEHVAPGRMPLFEILCQYHPIYWDVCGRPPGLTMLGPPPRAA